MTFSENRYPFRDHALSARDIESFSKSRNHSGALDPELDHAGTAPTARYHFPLLGIEAQGSFGGRGSPFCRSSIECLSGERTKAILPSRGGRLIVTPAFINFSQSA